MSNVSIPILPTTWDAEADLSGYQYCVVAQGVNERHIRICTTALEPLGVLVNKPLSGEAGSVIEMGVATLVAGAAITAGELLVVADALGRVGPASLTAGTVAHVIGRARTTVTAAGQKVQALIYPMIYGPAGRSYLPGYTAGADLTGKQYCAVKQGTAGECVVAAAAAERCLGILQNAPDEDDAAIIQTFGPSSYKADAINTLGDDLSVADANGELDTSPTTAVAEGNIWVVGQAIVAAGGAGAVTDGLFINMGYKWVPAA